MLALSDKYLFSDAMLKDFRQHQDLAPRTSASVAIASFDRHRHARQHRRRKALISGRKCLFLFRRRQMKPPVNGREECGFMESAEESVEQGCGSAFIRITCEREASFSGTLREDEYVGRLFPQCCNSFDCVYKSADAVPARIFLNFLSDAFYRFC
jgi:hypothetical protein